ncbi:MAG: ribonuclease H-like domain-containing protein [Anaerolineaceae bacterium]
MDSLSDRLKALGFLPASKLPKPSSDQSQFDFTRILNAQEIIGKLGVTYLVENQYPTDYQHGSINFQAITEIAPISTAANVKSTEDITLSNLLFLDTETTGLAGGTGTLAFLVGLGYFSPTGFLLKQYILKNPADESAMLLEIINLCDQFSGIVTFNGKGFDIPLLRTRYVLNRLPNPFDRMTHFDLLYLARKVWKNRLKSRALQDLEHEILDIPRTQDEVPGWMIPEIYFNFLRSNNPAPLKGVVYHNGMDILSLAALFLHLSSSFTNISNVDQFDPIDYYSLGQLYFDLGLREIALNIFLECHRQDKLPVHLKICLLQRLGDHYKFLGDYANALIFWQKGATYEDIDSSINIAKYYEHHAGDLHSALIWTESAITVLSKKGYDTYQNRKLSKELSKRKDRVLQKIERKNNNVSEKIE